MEARVHRRIMDRQREKKSKLSYLQCPHHVLVRVCAEPERVLLTQAVGR